MSSQPERSPSPEIGPQPRPPLITATRATLLAGAMATAAIAGAENWRTAVLALAAAGAIAATRVRFARQAAVLVLVTVATVCLSTSGPASDGRSEQRAEQSERAKRSKQSTKTVGEDPSKDERRAQSGTTR